MFLSTFFDQLRDAAEIGNVKVLHIFSIDRLEVVCLAALSLNMVCILFVLMLVMYNVAGDCEHWPSKPQFLVMY